MLNELEDWKIEDSSECLVGLRIVSIGVKEIEFHISKKIIIRRINDVF